MSDFRNYMWSVPDWRTDEMYRILDNREKGIYRELIDECWVARSLPNNLEELARFVREPVAYFESVWVKIRGKFRVVDNGQKLVSKRLEQDRRRFMLKSFEHAKKARKAAEIRWRNHRAEKEIHARSNAQALLGARQTQTQSNTEEESPSLLHSPNTEVLIVLKDSLSAEKRDSRIDCAAEQFRERCFAVTEAPYRFERGDFVQLAKLRKAYGIATSESPPGWAEGVAHYFDSPLAKYSIADLCVRYAVFKNSALNEFNKPVTHRGNGNGQRTIETKGEQLVRRQREENQRLDSLLRGAAGDSAGAGDSGRAGAALHSRVIGPD